MIFGKNIFLAWLFFLTLQLPSQAEADLNLKTYYKNDFILESEDGAFQLKIRGNLHLDGRLYQSEHRGAPHSVDIRRARIDLQGRIHKWFTFRLQTEVAGQPYLRNAWLDIEIRNWFHVRGGQMKVPFSSSFSTLDNNVNFIERATSTPVYPFFDRGILLWGELWNSTMVYNLGLFTGAGMDIDTPNGDQDDAKSLAAKLFFQPFRKLENTFAQGFFLVGQGTWELMTTPTRRFEKGGLRSPNYETSIWRWRTEQIIGSDGRMTDQVGAKIGSKWRWGLELHYVFKRFSLSVEHLQLYYENIRVYHDLYSGSSRAYHDELFSSQGTIRSTSAWMSIFITGESKSLSNSGWKTPGPQKNVAEGGVGALELLARYSYTDTDSRLFQKFRVDGLSAETEGIPVDYIEALPGSHNSISVSVLDGAHRVHEMTLGICWTLNPMVRIQLNDVFLWAPESDRTGDGQNDNLLLSGATSDQSNLAKRNLGTSWENAVMARLIFKL